MIECRSNYKIRRVLIKINDLNLSSTEVLANCYFSKEILAKINVSEPRAYFVVVFLDETSQSKSKSFIWSNAPVHSINSPRCIVLVNFFPLSWSTCCTSYKRHGRSRSQYSTQNIEHVNKGNSHFSRTQIWRLLLPRSDARL